MCCCGTVHDPLARLMAGTSGNAGLFSTAADLSLYCRMLLNGGSWQGKRILSPAAVALLTTAQSHAGPTALTSAPAMLGLKAPAPPRRLLPLRLHRDQSHDPAAGHLPDPPDQQRPPPR